MIEAARKAPLPRQGKKRCPHCREVKDYDADNPKESAFYIETQRCYRINPVDGFRVRSWCRNCERIRNRERYRRMASRDRARIAERSHKYWEKHRARRKLYMREQYAIRRDREGKGPRNRTKMLVNKRVWVDAQIFWQWAEDECRRMNVSLDTLLCHYPSIYNIRAIDGPIMLDTVDRILVHAGQQHMLGLLYPERASE